MYYDIKYGAPMKSFKCKVHAREIPKTKGLR